MKEKNLQNTDTKAQQNQIIKNSERHTLLKAITRGAKRERKTRMAADFSQETMQMKKQWNSIFKVLKEKLLIKNSILSENFFFSSKTGALRHT